MTTVLGARLSALGWGVSGGRTSLVPSSSSDCRSREPKAVACRRVGWHRATHSHTHARERAMDSTKGAAADAGWVTARTAGRGFRTEVTAGKHALVVDEPEEVGGSGDGPTPYDYLLTAIGACTAMTLRMYASRKGWPLEEAVVRFRTARSHAADCAECETKAVGVGRLEREVELRGPLDDRSEE